LGEAEETKTVVHTEEKGVFELNPAEREVRADRLGGNNKVIVLIIGDNLVFEIEGQGHFAKILLKKSKSFCLQRISQRAKMVSFAI
jgi:hypothetical protein